MRRRQRPAAIVIRTDGACSGNPGPAAIGVVLASGERRREISEYLGEASRLRFEWVPGHAGIAENERCDRIAREAIERGTAR
jgi:ribonuclease HI